MQPLANEHEAHLHLTMTTNCGVSSTSHGLSCTQVCASVLYRDANGTLRYNATTPTNDQPQVYLDDTGLIWDNVYFQNLLQYKGVLLSDQALYSDRYRMQHSIGSYANHQSRNIHVHCLGLVGCLVAGVHCK